MNKPEQPKDTKASKTNTIVQKADMKLNKTEDKRGLAREEHTNNFTNRSKDHNS